MHGPSENTPRVPQLDQGTIKSMYMMMMMIIIIIIIIMGQLSPLASVLFFFKIYHAEKLIQYIVQLFMTGG